MSSVLEFNGAARPKVREPRPVLRGDDVGEFWLDFERDSSDEAAEIEHTPARVLTEAFLILASAGLLALAVTEIMHGPTF